MQSFSSHTRNIAVASSLLVLGVLHVPGPAEALDSVSLITDFGYNGRHAYFFVALDKGYYKAAGLDVKILRGQGSVDAIRQVGAGNATFGFADTGSLVLARANDQIPVKLVASVYARPPQAIFCRENSGIRLPRISRNAQSPTRRVDRYRIFSRLCEGCRHRCEQGQMGDSEQRFAPTLLAANRTPCVGQFIVGEALLRAQAAPAKLVRFAYADSGLNYYGNGIVAKESTIAANPDLVRQFVDATVTGMKDAFARPDEAGAIMHKYHPQVDAGIARGETEAVAELAQVEGQPFGVIDPARIEATLDVMNGAFKLKTPVAAKDVYVSGLISK